MRKLFVTLTIAGSLIVPSTAQAFTRTERAASSAVERTVERDLDWDWDIQTDVAADCHRRGTQFNCHFSFFENPFDPSTFVDGKARVHKHGRRYVGQYRIYW